MTCMQTQDFIDLKNIKIDPATCVACIEWSEVPISTVKNDLEQGRLLMQKTFKGVNWSDYPGSLTSLLSRILKQLPQNKEYHHVTQGFADTLINDLMTIVKHNSMAEDA